MTTAILRMEKMYAQMMFDCPGLLPANWCATAGLSEV